MCKSTIYVACSCKVTTDETLAIEIGDAGAVLAVEDQAASRYHTIAVMSERDLLGVRSALVRWPEDFTSQQPSQ